MSIDAVVSRIDQILAMQQQLVDPAGAAASTSTVAGSAPAPATGVPLAAGDAGNATGQNFAGTLAVAQTGAATAAAGRAFSDLIASLGGPAGLTEGRQVVGHFP